VFAFSFTLHSFFVQIIDRMLLKCSSLSFSSTSPLIFCALIRWIPLLWLGVRPGGHQRGAGAISGMVVPEALLCPEAGETGWSGLRNRTVQFDSHRELVLLCFGTLSCCAATSSDLFSASGSASPLAEDSLLDPVLP
jgi:hypothetical protein